MEIFIGLLLIETHNRNHMRIIRRTLRDKSNPFEMPDRHFRQMFRLNKENVIELIQILDGHLQPSNIPHHLKVLATLNFLASGCFQNSIGTNNFIALSQSSISRIIKEVCEVMTIHLMKQWIKFPTNTVDKNQVKQGFYEKWGARGVVGVIDGTHVDILAPPVADEYHPPFVYINRKGKYSINVMLICDSDTKIIGSCARYPGSVHDSAIWQMSNIKQHMKIQFLNGDKNTHLIGDSGYPLEPWLLTPFNNVNPNTPEERFNNELKTVRNVIERTNGILKGRFRCLSRFRTLMYHPTRAASIIYACCILHNMALAANLPLQDDEIEYRDEANEFHRMDQNQEENLLEIGRLVRREYITQNIM